MADFVRQWTDIRSSSSTSITFTNDGVTTAGNTLIAVVGIRDRDFSTIAGSDPAGNTWVEVERLQGTESSAAQVIMHAQDVTPAGAVTFEVRGADGVSAPVGAYSALIFEVSGVGGVADVNKGFSSDDPSPLRLVDVPAGGFVIGGGTAGVTNRTFSPALSYTALSEYRGAQTTILGSWHVPSTTGPTAPSWTRTSGSATTLGNITVAYHPAGTDPDPDPPARVRQLLAADGIWRPATTTLL